MGWLSLVMGIPRATWVLIRVKQWNGILQIIVLTYLTTPAHFRAANYPDLWKHFWRSACLSHAFLLLCIFCTLYSGKFYALGVKLQTCFAWQNFSSLSSQSNHRIEAQVCSRFGWEAINRRLPVTWPTAAKPFWVATNDAPSHLVGRHTLCLPKWRWSCSRRDGDS